jgi:hypothetical protein
MDNTFIITILTIIFIIFLIYYFGDKKCKKVQKETNVAPIIEIPVNPVQNDLFVEATPENKVLNGVNFVPSDTYTGLMGTISDSNGSPVNFNAQLSKYDEYNKLPNLEKESMYNGAVPLIDLK